MKIEVFHVIIIYSVQYSARFLGIPIHEKSVLLFTPARIRFIVTDDRFFPFSFHTVIISSLKTTDETGKFTFCDWRGYNINTEIKRRRAGDDFKGRIYYSLFVNIFAFSRARFYGLADSVRKW